MICCVNIVKIRYQKISVGIILRKLLILKQVLPTNGSIIGSVSGVSTIAVGSVSVESASKLTIGRVSNI